MARVPTKTLRNDRGEQVRVTASDQKAQSQYETRGYHVVRTDGDRVTVRPDKKG